MRRRSWSPLPQGFLPSRNSGENLDRFIPNRSASNFDFLFIDRSERKENRPVISESREAYQKELAEIFGMNRTSIFSFKDKAPDPYLAELFPRHLTSLWPAKPTIRRRYIPRAPERTLSAPDLVEDECLSLLDWGSSNRLSIALGDTVYIWNASDSSISELVTFDHENAPVTSVNWAPDGDKLAVGLNNAEVQLWDLTHNALLTTLSGGHTSGVGSLAWNNNNILTTGGMDGQILNYDVRDPSRIVQTYRGHTQRVCELRWSASGKQLASGGSDNILHIWEMSMASSLHRLNEHRDTVNALAWCPFQRKLLASGGGDRTIKFWDTHTGACLDSLDTGSPVSALLWNKNERELLSSHGFPRNQLILWRYPSMVTKAELTSHSARVLFMAQSPDGWTVASATEDKKLMFWHAFGLPELAKPAPTPNPVPFAHWNGIR